MMAIPRRLPNGTAQIEIYDFGDSPDRIWEDILCLVTLSTARTARLVWVCQCSRAQVDRIFGPPESVYSFIYYLLYCYGLPEYCYSLHQYIEVVTLPPSQARDIQNLGFA